MRRYGVKLAVTVAIATSALGWAGDAAAVSFPVNDEFQVNSHTGNAQALPAVAFFPGGAFVVVWQSRNQDGDNYGIFGQRFLADGAPAGGEFQVNTTTVSSQLLPDVDAHDEGFVVTWASSENGIYTDIFARRFDPKALPIGDELQVNSWSDGSQTYPSIGMGSDGGFVVVWESNQEDGEGTGIFGRRYDSAGSAQAAPFQVNSYTGSVQGDPAIGMEDEGDFAVAWTGFGPGGLRGVWARRFDSSGASVGAEFRVSLHSSIQTRTEIGIADHGFVVAWQENLSDGSGLGVVARRAGATGVLIGSELQINSYTGSDQSSPSVAMEQDGDFVIAWDSVQIAGASQDVFAQRFGASGAREGGELRVNSTLTSFQSNPGASADPRGRGLVVAWIGDLADTGSTEVFAQRFGSVTTDIDANGEFSPLTDGLLYLRYLFGFRGDALIDGAVANDCGRCTAPEIEAFIDSLL